MHQSTVNHLNQLNDSPPKSHRQTTDGFACAAKFEAYGKIYTDCTSEMRPDGTLDTTKEWCFKEDSKDWANCKPVLDYDKVRE